MIVTVTRLSADPSPILQIPAKILFQLAEVCTAEGCLSILQFGHVLSILQST